MARRHPEQYEDAEAAHPVTQVSEDEQFNERFWSDSTLWPDDAPGYIFLPRAVQKLESLFYTEPLMAPPKSGSDIDDEEAAAIEDAFELYEAAQVVRRLDTVKKFMDACRTGTLACATRPKLGGAFQELDRSIWNSELCHRLFRFCDISLEAPYADDEWTPNTAKQWLFVTSESLTRFDASEQATGPSTPSRHLSPYVSLMLGVIDALNITPTNQPGVKELVSELGKRWQEMGNKSLSGRLSSSMATLVRDLESQAGGNKPQSKIKKKSK